MRTAKPAPRPADKDRAVRALALHTAYKGYSRKAAELLQQRLEFDRAADARDLAEWIGYRDSRYIYDQAAGEAPLQQRTVFALAVDDPEGARQLLQLEASAHGYELRPAPCILAAAPSLHDALQSITDGAICCSESTALEYAIMHDGTIDDPEMEAAEAQWALEDQKREQKRAAVRAMHRSRSGAPDGQLANLEAERLKLRKQSR